MEEPIEDFVLRLRDSKYGQVVVKGVEEYINTGSLSTYERLMDDFCWALSGLPGGTPVG